MVHYSLNLFKFATRIRLLKTWHGFEDDSDY